MNKEYEWINVEDKMPFSETDVIVCIKDEYGDNPYYYTTIGWYLEKGQCWIVDNEVRYDIIAWQPLPTPCYEENFKESKFDLNDETTFTYKNIVNTIPLVLDALKTIKKFHAPFKCPMCGAEWLGTNSLEYNYCPNCGCENNELEES